MRLFACLHADEYMQYLSGPWYLRHVLSMSMSQNMLTPPLFQTLCKLQQACSACMQALLSSAPGAACSVPCSNGEGLQGSQLASLSQFLAPDHSASFAQGTMKLTLVICALFL